MHQRLFIVAGGLFCALAASGCVTTDAYVEGGHDKADFSDLRPRNPPTPVLVVADFRVNGESQPNINQTVFNEVVRVLQNSKVLKPVSGDPGLTLTVLVDDSVDLDQARHQGLITGLSEGLIGNSVRDEYRFTYSLQAPDAKPQTGLYRHAMITVTGTAPPPGAGKPHSASDAFAIILQQSVLEFLADLQTVEGTTPVLFVPDTPPGAEK
jgi:hypothetical protein